jgi:hypothetical protein
MLLAPARDEGVETFTARGYLTKRRYRTETKENELGSVCSTYATTGKRILTFFFFSEALTTWKT